MIMCARQRKIFQKLGEAEMIELLLPHMLERSKRFQSADDANEVLDVLARRLQDLAPTGDAIQSITTRKVDKLGYVLKQMPFHALASLIFARSDFDPDFLDRSEAQASRRSDPGDSPTSCQAASCNQQRRVLPALGLKLQVAETTARL
eukprot:s7905_g3.t1